MTPEQLTAAELAELERAVAARLHDADGPRRVGARLVIGAQFDHSSAIGHRRPVGIAHCFDVTPRTSLTSEVAGAHTSARRDVTFSRLPVGRGSGNHPDRGLTDRGPRSFRGARP